MTHPTSRAPVQVSGFTLAMITIFIGSILLRFWGLSRFNTLVFDEVYYAKFGNNYLTQTPFFNSHPPVSQYLIAIGIWLGSKLPFGQETVNQLTGSTLSTWSYRWFNALFGSFIPLMVGAIAYQLTHRRSYTLIATFLMAIDGLFIVESRYALSNIYIVFFGLLGQLFFLIALQKKGLNRWFWMSLAGIGLGLSIATKWNGLGFLVGIYGIVIAGFIVQKISEKSDNKLTESSFKSPLQNLNQLTPILSGVTLILIPILVYIIAWLPHLQQNPTPGFWGLQTKIWAYHQNLGDGEKVHPYCSKWYSWLLMLRPVAYFFTKIEATTSPNPILPLNHPEQLPLIYAVHAMGNPFLWWLSTLGSLLLIGMLIQRIWREVSVHFPQLKPQSSFQFPPTPELWLTTFLTLNWLANLLPWVEVSRCLFIYHYMTGFVFSCMALAWWLERWLYSHKPQFRWLGGTVIFLVLFGFLYWMPLYLGLPLSPGEWKMRMWFQSWI
ncbi:dolichyl-phosphate-mannose--protein mannosyltransferase [Planktothrix pseudagardhii]|uniref:Polyprenol-phosphate-mannose--protein mannosyltransferase n=1 Tax=Planktothrix pseudagardhii TaxID=132604 RepID=A0A9W4CRX9_9CYAN|nr:phospholipid carrier-dependent glycosyltransferase [Planktothrix pseudagardhii]CAD5979586.1 Protein O-mannosyl-transferase 1 [Planktothrix pseudagardhii]